MNRKDELEQKLKALCEEYKDFDVFSVVAGDDKSFTFCGTACPVCILEVMARWIEKENIQHKFNDKMEKADKVH